MVPWSHLGDAGFLSFSRKYQDASAPFPPRCAAKQNRGFPPLVSRVSVRLRTPPRLQLAAQRATNLRLRDAASRPQFGFRRDASCIVFYGEAKGQSARKKSRRTIPSQRYAQPQCCLCGSRRKLKFNGSQKPRQPLHRPRVALRFTSLSQRVRSESSARLLSAYTRAGQLSFGISSLTACGAFCLSETQIEFDFVRPRLPFRVEGGSRSAHDTGFSALSSHLLEEPRDREILWENARVTPALRESLSAHLSACRAALTVSRRLFGSGRPASNPGDRHLKNIFLVDSRWLETAAATERREQRRCMSGWCERVGPSGADVGVSSWTQHRDFEERRERPDETRRRLVASLSFPKFSSLLAGDAHARPLDSGAVSKPNLFLQAFPFDSNGPQRPCGSRACWTSSLPGREETGRTNWCLSAEALRECGGRGERPLFVFKRMSKRIRVPALAISPSLLAPPLAALLPAASPLSPFPAERPCGSASKAGASTIPQTRVASSSVFSLDLSVDGTASAPVCKHFTPDCLSFCSLSARAPSAVCVLGARVRSVVRLFAGGTRARGELSETGEGAPLERESVASGESNSRPKIEEVRHRRMTETRNDRGRSRPQPLRPAGVMPAVCTPSSDPLPVDGVPRLSSRFHFPTHSGLSAARFAKETRDLHFSASPSPLDSSSSSSCSSALRRWKLSSPTQCTRSSRTAVRAGTGCFLLCLILLLVLLAKPAGELQDPEIRWEGGEEPAPRCRVGPYRGSEDSAATEGERRLRFAFEESEGEGSLAETTTGPVISRGRRLGPRADSAVSVFESSPLASRDRKHVSVPHARTSSFQEITAIHHTAVSSSSAASSRGFSRSSARGETWRETWRRGEHAPATFADQFQDLREDEFNLKVKLSMARSDDAGALARHRRMPPDRGGSRDRFPSFALYRGDRLLPFLRCSSHFRQYSPMLASSPFACGQARSRVSPKLQCRAKEDHAAPERGPSVFSPPHRSQPRPMQPEIPPSTGDEGAGEAVSAVAPSSTHLCVFSHKDPSGLAPLSSWPETRNIAVPVPAEAIASPSANLPAPRVHADDSRAATFCTSSSSTANADCVSPGVSSLLARDAFSDSTLALICPAGSTVRHRPCPGRARAVDRGDTAGAGPAPVSVSPALGRKSRRPRLGRGQRRTDGLDSREQREASHQGRDTRDRSYTTRLSSPLTDRRRRPLRVPSPSHAASAPSVLAEDVGDRELFRVPHAVSVGASHSVSCRRAWRSGVGVTGGALPACQSRERSPEGEQCCGDNSRGEPRIPGRGSSRHTSETRRKSPREASSKEAPGEHSEGRGVDSSSSSVSAPGAEAPQNTTQGFSDASREIRSNGSRDSLSEGDAGADMSNSFSSLSPSSFVSSPSSPSPGDISSPSSLTAGSIARPFASSLSRGSLPFSPRLAALVATAAAVAVRSSSPQAVHASAVSTPRSDGVRDDEGPLSGAVADRELSRSSASLPPLPAESRAERDELQEPTRRRVSLVLGDARAQTATFVESRNGAEESAVVDREFVPTSASLPLWPSAAVGREAETGDSPHSGWASSDQSSRLPSFRGETKGEEWSGERAADAERGSKAHALSTFRGQQPRESPFLAGSLLLSAEAATLPEPHVGTHAEEESAEEERAVAGSGGVNDSIDSTSVEHQAKGLAFPQPLTDHETLSPVSASATSNKQADMVSPTSSLPSSLAISAAVPLFARDEGHESPREGVSGGGGRDSGVHSGVSEPPRIAAEDADASDLLASTSGVSLSSSPPIARFAAASSSSIVPHQVASSAGSLGRGETGGLASEASESRLSSHGPSSLLEERERGRQREGDARAGLQSLIVLSITGDLYHVTTNGSFVWQRSLGSSLATAFDLEPETSSSEDEPRRASTGPKKPRGDAEPRRSPKSPEAPGAQGPPRAAARVEDRGTSELAQTGLGRRLLPAHDGSLFFLDDDGSLTALHVSIPEVVNHLPFQAPLFPHVYFTGEREVRVTALDLETGQPIAGHRRRGRARGKGLRAKSSRQGARDRRTRRPRAPLAREPKRHGDSGGDRGGVEEEAGSREEVQILEDGSRRVRRDESREKPFVFESLSLAPRPEDVQENQETAETISGEDDSEEETDEPRQLQFGVTVWKLWAVDNKAHTTQWGLKWVEVDALGSLTSPGAAPSSRVAYLRNILRVDDDKLYLLPSPSFSSSPLGRVETRDGGDEGPAAEGPGDPFPAQPSSERLTRLRSSRASPASFAPSFAPFTSTSPSQNTAPLFLKFPAPIAAVYVVGPPDGEGETEEPARRGDREDGRSVLGTSRLVLLSDHEEDGSGDQEVSSDPIRPWGEGTTTRGTAGEPSRMDETGRRLRDPAKNRRRKGGPGPLVTLECIVRQWGEGAAAIPFAYVPSSQHAVRGDREAFPAFAPFAFPSQNAHSYASLLLPSMRRLGGSPGPALAPAPPRLPGHSGRRPAGTYPGDEPFDSLVWRDREVALPAPPGPNYLEDLKRPLGEEAHADDSLRDAHDKAGRDSRPHSLLPAPLDFLPTSSVSSSLVPTDDRSPLSASFSASSLPSSHSSFSASHASFPSSSLSLSSTPSPAHAPGSQRVLSPYALHNFRAPAPVQPVRLSHPEAFASQVTLWSGWESPEFPLDSRMQSFPSGREKTVRSGALREPSGGFDAEDGDREENRETADKIARGAAPREGDETRKERARGKETPETDASVGDGARHALNVPQLELSEKEGRALTPGGGTGAAVDEVGTRASPLYGVPPSQLPALYGAFDAAPLSFNPVLSPVLSVLRRWVGRLTRPSARFFLLPLLSPEPDEERGSSAARPDDLLAGKARRHEGADRATVCGVEDREARSSALFFPSSSLNSFSPSSPSWLTPHAQAPPNYVVSLRPDSRRGDRRACGAEGRRASSENGPEPEASPEPGLSWLAPGAWAADLLAPSWAARLLFLLAAASSMFVVFRFRGLVSGLLAGVLGFLVPLAGHPWRPCARVLFLLLPPPLRPRVPLAEDGRDGEEREDATDLLVRPIELQGACTLLSAEEGASPGHLRAGRRPSEVEERPGSGVVEDGAVSPHASGGQLALEAWSGASEVVALPRPLSSPVWATPRTFATPARSLDFDAFAASSLDATQNTHDGGSALSPTARALQARDARGGRDASWAVPGKTGLRPPDGASSHGTLSAIAWTGRGGTSREEIQRDQDARGQTGAVAWGTETAPSAPADVAEDMRRLVLALESRARKREGLTAEGRESHADSGNRTPMYSCRTASSVSMVSEDESDRRPQLEALGDLSSCREFAAEMGTDVQTPGEEASPRQGLAKSQWGDRGAGRQMRAEELRLSELRARRKVDSPLVQTVGPPLALPGQGDIRFYRRGSSLAAVSSGGSVCSSSSFATAPNARGSRRSPAPPLAPGACDPFGRHAGDTATEQGVSVASVLDLRCGEERAAAESPFSLVSSRSTGERMRRARAPSSPMELIGERMQSSPFLEAIRSARAFADEASILPPPLVAASAGLPGPLPIVAPDSPDACCAGEEIGFIGAAAPGAGGGGMAFGGGRGRPAEPWEVRGRGGGEGQARPGDDTHDGIVGGGEGLPEGEKRQTERETVTPIYLPGGRMGGGYAGEMFSAEEWQRVMFRRAGRRCNSVGQLTVYGGGHEASRGSTAHARGGMPKPLPPVLPPGVCAEAGATPQSDVLPVRPGPVSPRPQTADERKCGGDSGGSSGGRGTAMGLADPNGGVQPLIGDVDSASASSPSVRAASSQAVASRLLPSGIHEVKQETVAVSLPSRGDSDEGATPESRFLTDGVSPSPIATRPSSTLPPGGGLPLAPDEARGSLAHGDALKALEALSGVTTAYVGSASGSVGDSANSASGAVLKVVNSEVAGVLDPSGLVLTSAARLLMAVGGGHATVEEGGTEQREAGLAGQEVHLAGAARPGDGLAKSTTHGGGVEGGETEKGPLEAAADGGEGSAAALPPPAAPPVEGGGATGAIVRAGLNVPEVAVVAPPVSPVPAKVDRGIPPDSSLAKLLENGRFERTFAIQKLVGQGGFGVVYQVRHLLEPGHPIYAVKLILLRLTLSEDISLRRDFREVAANRDLYSKHVVRYYTWWCEEPRFLPVESLGGSRGALTDRRGVGSSAVRDSGPRASVGVTTLTMSPGCLDSARGSSRFWMESREAQKNLRRTIRDSAVCKSRREDLSSSFLAVYRQREECRRQTSGREATGGRGLAGNASGLWRRQPARRRSLSEASCASTSTRRHGTAEREELLAKSQTSHLSSEAKRDETLRGTLQRRRRSSFPVESASQRRQDGRETLPAEFLEFSLRSAKDARSQSRNTRSASADSFSPTKKPERRRRSSLPLSLSCGSRSREEHRQLERRRPRATSRYPSRYAGRERGRSRTDEGWKAEKKLRKSARGRRGSESSYTSEKTDLRSWCPRCEKQRSVRPHSFPTAKRRAFSIPALKERQEEREEEAFPSWFFEQDEDSFLTRGMRIEESNDHAARARAHRLLCCSGDSFSDAECTYTNRGSGAFWGAGAEAPRSLQVSGGCTCRWTSGEETEGPREASGRGDPPGRGETKRGERRLSRGGEASELRPAEARQKTQARKKGKLRAQEWSGPDVSFDMNCYLNTQERDMVVFEDENSGESNRASSRRSREDADSSRSTALNGQGRERFSVDEEARREKEKNAEDSRRRGRTRRDLLEAIRPAELAREKRNGLQPPAKETLYPVVLLIQMEMCNGVTLREWLDRKDRSTVAMGFVPSSKNRWHSMELELFKQLMKGIRDIHERGIVHRDLKPENIFVDPDTLVLKIVDFGLAKFIQRENPSGAAAGGAPGGLEPGGPGGADGLDVGERNREKQRQKIKGLLAKARRMGKNMEMSYKGEVIGTPAYAAPEGGGLCDEKADIYSSALILLELL
ncbi:eIF2 kinase IF2K-A (incomplete catalytic triad), partial [Toxoplasma gondii FOU]